MNSSYYGWIGIPLNFFYSTNQDIDRFNLKLRNEPIDWNSKYGEMLEKSLILTDDEKLFGITKATMELRNYNYIHKPLVPAFTTFGLYCSAQWVNRRFGLFHFPRMVSDEFSKISTEKPANFVQKICEFCEFFTKKIGPHNDVRTDDNVCIWDLFGGY